jgi:tRNA(Ile)-lysidine synthase TilS/MesJ
MKRCRSSGIRAVYEEVTRRIRFSFYSWFDCPVVLGHNLDDCFENVFRNLSQRIHFDNLFGMSAIGVEQGVTIVRPMLGIAKKDIVAFADSMGIPHLYDSTPAWSQRGQMRDRLLPGIQSFDPNILKGLADFAKHTTFLENQWNLSFQTWRQSVAISEKSVYIPRNTFFESNKSQTSFWITVWKDFGLDKRPSNRSFQNLIEFLERGTAKCCNLNASWCAILSDAGVQLLLR